MRVTSTPALRRDVTPAAAEPCGIDRLGRAQLIGSAGLTPAVLSQVEDITSFGGWRAYLARD
ncbi:MAG: hypothetical protein ABW215_02400 [Kibdelosporangium sp.]